LLHGLRIIPQEELEAHKELLNMEIDSGEVLKEFQDWWLGMSG
jgi:hypothetical protein